jgi:hypothetical protein
MTIRPQDVLLGPRPQHSRGTWVSGHFLARRQERDVFVDAVFEEIGRRCSR